MSQRGFLTLPHDVIKYLCRFVDSLSLIALARTCKYLLPDCLVMARQRSLTLFGPQGCCKVLHLYGTAQEALKPKVRAVQKVANVVSPVDALAQSTLSFGTGGKPAVVKGLPPTPPPSVREVARASTFEHRMFWAKYGIDHYLETEDIREVVVNFLKEYGSVSGFLESRHRQKIAATALDAEFQIVVKSFPTRLAALGACLVGHKLCSKEEWTAISLSISYESFSSVPFKIVDRARMIFSQLPLSVYLNTICVDKPVKYDEILGFLKVGFFFFFL